MDRLAEIGRAKGWASIRWITAEDNYRARSFYGPDLGRWGRLTK